MDQKPAESLAISTGRLGMESAEVLPGIIGEIISWILNRTANMVGWVLQNLWALIVVIESLLYTYAVTK